MESETPWRRTIRAMVACLCLAALLSACGRHSVRNDTRDTVPAGAARKGVGLLTITQDEVGSLPQWQQDLLNDPGWNQPPIPQRTETPMPAPALPKVAASSAKAVRGWDDQCGLPNQVDIAKGEYNIACGAPIGCGAGCANGHQLDKKISAEPTPPGTPYAVNWVCQLPSSSNFFNSTGGSANQALASRFQVFADKQQGEGQPQAYAEIAYRADGGPGAGGDPCHASQAYTINDFIFAKYNSSRFNALPNLDETPLYNILIAPSSEESAPQTSSGGTVAHYQSFYMGTLADVYGGSEIVSIESSSSSCQLFNSAIQNRLSFTNPVYGVILRRWQDSVLKSMPQPDNVPWKGEFGWPVYGPTAYDGGAQTLTANGAYYAWGEYFERGFIWWIDYVNNANVPDEAQAWLFTGDNIFCKNLGDTYEKQATIYYGGTGPLGVCVAVEASVNLGSAYYEVAEPAGRPLLLDMHAHAYGGTPRTDGRYKYYTWAFRDGTLGVTNGAAYDNSTQYVQHAFNEAANYIVRVQVTDANGNVAYGDSLPIHVNFTD